MEPNRRIKRVPSKPKVRMKRDLLNAAKDLDIPVLPFIEDTDYWQFGWGKNSKVFYYSSPLEDSHIGVTISKDKLQSKKLLENIGIPIPKSEIIKTQSELEILSEKIGFPCVVKPTVGSGGQGITANIKDMSDLKLSYENARKSRFGRNPILIEEFIEGDDFRLIVAYGKFLSAVRRKPPFIIGDGKRSIKELIIKKNLSFKKDGLKKEIKITQRLVEHLKRFNFTIHSIPKEEEKVALSSTANLVSGGDGDDATHLVHPQLIQMSEELAKITNIAVLGLDYLTTDITKPFYETNGAVTEFNHYISLGSADFYYDRKVFFERIFGILPARIPIDIIVTSKEEQVLILEFLKSKIVDNGFGFLCHEELYLGKMKLSTASNSFKAQVKTLLRQKSLERALVVCTKEELIKKDFPLDKLENIYEYRLEGNSFHEKNISFRYSVFKKINILDEIVLKKLKI